MDLVVAKPNNEIKLLIKYLILFSRLDEDL